jgi:CheY-like chemotaxis protein
MPKMNRHEALKIARKIPGYGQIPIFIYSTSSAIKEKERCLEEGACGFITKHHSYEDLCIELNQIIQKL